MPPLFKPPVVRLTGLPDAGVIVTPLPLVTVLLPTVSVVGYALDDARISDAERKHLRYFEDPREACAGADLVTTDVWTSMGYEAENEARRAAFANFCVDAPMIASAHPDALFMHCLPAHRGEEVTAEVIDGPQSVVWDEAENRLHVQKALLEYLVIGRVPV